MAINCDTPTMRNRAVGFYDTLKQLGKATLAECASEMNLTARQLEDISRSMINRGYVQVVGKVSLKSEQNGNNCFFVYAVKDAIPANYATDVSPVVRNPVSNLVRRGVMGQPIHVPLKVIPYRTDPMMAWIPQRVSAHQ